MYMRDIIEDMRLRSLTLNHAPAAILRGKKEALTEATEAKALEDGSFVLCCWMHHQAEEGKIPFIPYDT